MEIRVLQYFLAIVREESISRAAESLHVTQPTLSRQIAQLEEEIGAKLFERGAKRIALTREGGARRRSSRSSTRPARSFRSRTSSSRGGSPSAAAKSPP